MYYLKDLMNKKKFNLKNNDNETNEELNIQTISDNEELNIQTISHEDMINAFDAIDAFHYRLGLKEGEE